jgi:hypothetical protein
LGESLVEDIAELAQHFFVLAAAKTWLPPRHEQLDVSNQPGLKSRLSTSVVQNLCKRFAGVAIRSRDIRCGVY